tara:strand:+ start:8326 stop:9171 length:846 start_codon:yes stop_codon:yes gene_type:complete
MAQTKGGGASTTTFSRSVDPIKKIAEVNFDAVTDGSTPLTTEDWLEKVFYPFIPAELTFDSIPYQEKGKNTNTVTLGGNVIPRDENDLSAWQLKEGNNLINTYTSPTNPTPPSTVKQYWSEPNYAVTQDQTLKIFLTVGNNGTQQTLEKERDISFYYPTYYAVGPAGITEANQAQLKPGGASSDGQAIKASQVSSHSFTTNNDYIYIAYPSGTGYSPLTNAIEPISAQNYRSALEFVKPDGTLSSTAVTQEFQFADSSTHDYYVYRWKTTNSPMTFTLELS